MATATSFTAARMLEIENSTVVGGFIGLDGHLLLERRDGGTIDAGMARGADGDDAMYNVIGANTGPVSYWKRLALLDGVSAVGGAHIQFLISGLGDYGTPRRGTALFHVSQRGSNVIGVQSWSWGLAEIAAAFPFRFFTRQMGEFTFEVWVKLPTYSVDVNMQVYSQLNVTLTLDNTTDVDPGSLIEHQIKDAIPDRLNSAVALTTEDLNTILDTGAYIQKSSANATAPRNYPANIAGYLEVIRLGSVSGNSVDCMQRYTQYNTGTANVWIRTWYGSWGAWTKVSPNDWSQIGSKPTEFPPENHDANKITSGTISTARLPAASESARGTVEIATNTEVDDASATTLMVSPATLRLEARRSFSLPNPVRVNYNAPTNTITASTWANAPGIDATTINFPYPCWVLLEYGAWMSAPTGDLRAGMSLSGATTLDANDIPGGDPIDGWAVILWMANDYKKDNATRLVQVNAGNTTFRMQAYSSGSGTRSLNYPYYAVIPLRWAG